MAVNLANPVNWQHPLNRGLVSWYRSIGSPYSGGNSWHDMCHNADAIVYGGAKFDRKLNCQSGLGLTTGTGMYAQTPAAKALGSEFSVTFRLKYNSGTFFGIFSHAIDDTAGWNINLFTDLKIYDGSAYRTSGYGIAAGVDYWIAVVVSGSTSTFYIRSDGVNYSASDSFTSRTEANCGFTIGRFWQDTSGYEMPGTIDDIRVYKRALSSEQVNSAYFSHMTGYKGAINIVQAIRPTIFLPSAGSFKSAWARGSNVILQPGVLT